MRPSSAGRAEHDVEHGRDHRVPLVDRTEAVLDAGATLARAVEGDGVPTAMRPRRAMPVIKESESGEPSPPWTTSRRAGAPGRGAAGENSHASSGVALPADGETLDRSGPAVEGGVEARPVGPPCARPSPRAAPVASTYQNPA